jgi:tRNA(Ile)-lysidine synthase
MPGGLNTSTTLSPFDAAIRYARGLPDDTTVAVALSGGGDSVGLLAALCEAPCFQTRRVRLAAITVDHGLRPESAGEAVAMAEFCQARSIPHLTMSWQGDKPTSGLSDAARQARYRLLAEGVERLGADCLVTAHTLDDQLETVEMRRQRSDTSLRGLAGIAPATLFFGRLAVHRPFLGVRRADIRAFLGQHGIRWFDDPSNDNPHYERVRVRQSGQFTLDLEAIAAAADRRIAAAETAAAYVDAHVRMPLPLLFELPLPVDDDAGNLVLATLIAVAGGQPHLPGQEQLERLRDALLTKNAVSLGRTVVERRRQALYIGRDRRNLPALQLPPGDSVDWDGRFRVVNGSSAVVTIAPSIATGEQGEGVPSRVARRALATLADCSVPAHARAGLVVFPLLAPFETVLLSFDRTLSDALCRVLGRPVFPCFLGAGVETFPASGYKESGG